MIITDAIQKVLKESEYKPNKIWVDKGSKFYNRSWLQDNDTKMYSTHDEGNLLHISSHLDLFSTIKTIQDKKFNNTIVT